MEPAASKAPESRIRLSIIVPMAVDESLPEALLSTLGDPAAQIERILAVAGAAVDRPSGDVRMVNAPLGRGSQQNAGAALANGDWLWFLHADSILPDGALARVMDFIMGEAALGYCRLRFADDGPCLSRLNAIGANLRSRWLGLPYGDQGLCLPARWFRSLGGFREDLERGEDLDLVVRAGRAGLPIRCMGPRLTSSARRYAQQGWFKTTLNHQRQAWRLIREARRR
ncbi:MAG: glycosyltransferase [Wenzhouxiangella sp.]|nr:glycosyltransferase [Wenzhouxiangella sp.]